MKKLGNTLYLECSSGISGDMTVAALLDLGADREVLKKALSSLPLEGFSIEVTRIKKSGLDACDFLVRLDEAHENHDHDMEYLHGTKVHAHGEAVHAHGNETHVHVQGPSSHVHGDESHAHAHVHESGEHHHMHPHEDEHSHSHSHGSGDGHHSSPHIHRGLNEVL